MAWFRRRQPIARVDVGTYVAPPEQPPPPLEDLVDEAELIAEQAVRLAITNSLLLRALRDDRPYSETEMRSLARDQFDRVAKEAEQDAARKAHPRARAEDDSERQARRKAVSAGLAQRLRASATDDATLHRLVDRSRDSALDDILTAYVSAASRGRSLEPEELARRRALVALDLQDLKPGY